jgi:hypothetical protein
MLAALVVATMATAACDRGAANGGAANGAAGAPTTPAGATSSPVPTPPPADACRAGDSVNRVDTNLTLYNEEPVPCTQRHQTETVYVGEFAGTTATYPPRTGDKDYTQAFTTCAKQAKGVLGGDWHLARVELVVLLPANDEWQAGAHWFRCELLETSDVLQTHVVTRTASVRDGLKGKKPLAITCVTYTQNRGEQMIAEYTYVSCAKPHHAELTGLFTNKAAKFQGLKKNHETIVKACYAITAKYLGLTVPQLDSTGGVEWVYWGGDEDHWNHGDRTSRCFAGAYPRRKFTGSIAGRSPQQF